MSITAPPPRGLDRTLFQKLTSGEWIDRHQDLLVTGPTGTGKTWLSCALGHRACRDNRSVLYQRVPRLLEGLGVARGDGRYGRMLKNLAQVQLLILVGATAASGVHIHSGICAIVPSGWQTTSMVTPRKPCRRQTPTRSPQRG